MTHRLSTAARGAALAAAALLGGCATPPRGGAPPVPSAAQVEADGRRQDALRWGGGAPPADALTAERAAIVAGRGLRLADELGRAGLDAEAERRALARLEARAKALPAGPSGEASALAAEARRAIRELALRNPLLDFDAIVFVKGAPGIFPHMSDQFYGWWSRPGGGVYVLEGFKGPRARVRCLTEGWPEGSFIRPDVSYDGRRILFAYSRHVPGLADLKDKAAKEGLPEEGHYHLYEMNVDGTGVRQLTRGRYHDFDARYLPDGDIVFLSTRKGTFLQSSKAATATTAGADLPDSYVRCGGDAYRPVPVFTLHAMGADGSDLRPVSAFENFEYTPSVADDGRILFTRWDYIDRFNGHFFSLWACRPDGAGTELVYGNYTVKPQVIAEARPVPGSRKLAAVASAHHSHLGGSLILIDRTRGTEEQAPLTRLTPDVPFPETESWADQYYANPWPLSETFHLVAWSDRRLPPHCRVETSDKNPVNATGLYLYDAFGNLVLLYRDPELSSACPIPLRPRPCPPALPDTVRWTGPPTGRFVLQDVYRGLTGVPAGTVKRLRVAATVPKVQPNMDRPNIGPSAEDPAKIVLGTVPVEADGSANFEVPSGMSVMFQALDERGVAVQTMRSLAFVMPGQSQSCVGCHESRESAVASPRPPLALQRPPSKLDPGPEGSWPFRFDRLVQPVLDRHCVSCHQPGGADPKATALDLRPAAAYDSLMNAGKGNLRALAKERDRSVPGECVAQRSRLWGLLTAEGGHAGVNLDADSLSRLATWMDLYAQRQGHYSERQEEELRRFRDTFADLLAAP